MSGIVGGVAVEGSIRQMLDVQVGTGEVWEHERGDVALAARGEPLDPTTLTVLGEGTRAGVVYGAVTNRPELGWSDEELLAAVLDRPSETATALDGDFLLVAHDASADRLLVVTDKLGARACFYTPDGDLRFGTSVESVLPALSSATLDEQAASDMLLMGHLWGDRTPVREVRMVRPSTVLEVDTASGERTTTRYWRPSYETMEAGEPYLSELVERYYRAFERLHTTLPESVGLWLSGGLDSRTTAAAFQQTGDALLTGYVYDANPPTNDNPRIARKVADRLGMSLEEVPLDGDRFARNVGRAVDATDGMMSWHVSQNISALYNMDSHTPVMMEGIKGELFGDHLLRPHLTDHTSAVTSQLASEGANSPATVRSLLDVEVDPLESLRDEVRHTPETSFEKRVKDIQFQNYYSRGGLTTNRVMTGTVGYRVPYVDGDLLEWSSRLPLSYRKGAFPFADHRVPYGTSRAKLELCRRVAPDLADITYERTKLKPSYPYHLHVAGFVANVGTGMLQSKATYGSGQLTDFWLRETDSPFHERVSRLVDDACDRPLFRADAVRDVYDAHMDGENNVRILGPLTTLEHWVGTHLD
jgi:asparagine synthase (glutamine-hydrolysing)